MLSEIIQLEKVTYTAWCSGAHLRSEYLGSQDRRLTKLRSTWIAQCFRKIKSMGQESQLIVSEHYLGKHDNLSLNLCKKPSMATHVPITPVLQRVEGKACWLAVQLAPGQEESQKNKMGSFRTGHPISYIDTYSRTHAHIPHTYLHHL